MTSTIAANSSLCPRCGAGLRCGVVTGDATCWCFNMPRVIPVPPANDTQQSSCLCAACLQQLIELNADRHALFPATN